MSNTASIPRFDTSGEDRVLITGSFAKHGWSSEHVDCLYGQQSGYEAQTGCVILGREARKLPQVVRVRGQAMRNYVTMLMFGYVAEEVEEEASTSIVKPESMHHIRNLISMADAKPAAAEAMPTRTGGENDYGWTRRRAAIRRAAARFIDPDNVNH